MELLRTMYGLTLNFASFNADSGFQTPKRPRPKKVVQAPVTNNAHSRDSIRAIVDALDASILTPKVWIELVRLVSRIPEGTRVR